MSNEIVSDLKTKYSSIYSVSDGDGTEYFFRALTVKEVRLVEEFVQLKLKNSFEIEQFCIDNCVLHPPILDVDDISLGAAKQLVDEILRVSGVADSSYILELMGTVRASLAGDIIQDIKTYILSAIPGYTDEDLDEFTLLELLEKLVLSENILTLQSRLAGLDQPVELSFEYADGSQVEKEHESVKKQKEQSEDAPSKEELIKRIQKDNASNYSSRGTYVNPSAGDEWQGFDTGILDKMEGKFDPDDPIARKLHGL